MFVVLFFYLLGFGLPGGGGALVKLAVGASPVFDAGMTAFAFVVINVTAHL